MKTPLSPSEKQQLWRQYQARKRTATQRECVASLAKQDDGAIAPSEVSSAQAVQAAQEKTRSPFEKRFTARLALSLPDTN